MKQARRTFLIHSAAATALAGAALLVQTPARAQAQALSESDSMAQAPGYKNDASTVDKAKYPKYAAGQSCSNCSFFKAKPDDACATCIMFVTKLVSAKGWCGSYNRKA